MNDMYKSGEWGCFQSEFEVISKAIEVLVEQMKIDDGGRARIKGESLGLAG